MELYVYIGMYAAGLLGGFILGWIFHPKRHNQNKTIKMNTESKKVWKERHLYFEIDTKAIIAPNETMDGVTITLQVPSDKTELRAYLTYEEAIELSNEIKSFVNEIK